MDKEQSQFNCGVCDLQLLGYDEQLMGELFAEHRCPRTEYRPTWYEAVFSWAGIIIFAIVAYATVAALTGGAW